MEKASTLLFEELDELDAPLAWYDHAGYLIAAAGIFVAIAT
jgi:hypothetical protein